MLRVKVESVDTSEIDISAIANRVQSWFLFGDSDAGAAQEAGLGGANMPAIHLVDDELVAPFVVSRDGPIRISTWEAGPIAAYAGISTAEYWVICAMMGLVQWRTLQLNSLLIPEDFVHEPTGQCLYGAYECKPQFSLALEQGQVCRGCRDFYHCLGADRELLALVETVDALLHRGKHTTGRRGPES